MLIPVPPAIVSVSVVAFAVVDPESLDTVANKFCIFFADLFLGTGYVIYIMTLALYAFWFSQTGKKIKNRFGAAPKK